MDLMKRPMTFEDFYAIANRLYRRLDGADSAEEAAAWLCRFIRERANNEDDD